MLTVQRMTAFAIFVFVGSSFRLASTAIVAETEKSSTSFPSFQDLFPPTTHWPFSLLGMIYPGNFRDKCVRGKDVDYTTRTGCCNNGCELCYTFSV